jgi:hypothetical protein
MDLADLETSVRQHEQTHGCEVLMSDGRHRVCIPIRLSTDCEAPPESRGRLVRYRHGAALLGAFLLFGWGLAVSLGTGIGYDAPIQNWQSAHGLWQLLKSLPLIGIAYAVVAEVLEAEEERQQARFLNWNLNLRSQQLNHIARELLAVQSRR